MRLAATGHGLSSSPPFSVESSSPNRTPGCLHREHLWRPRRVRSRATADRHGDPWHARACALSSVRLTRCLGCRRCRRRSKERRGGRADPSELPAKKSLPSVAVPHIRPWRRARSLRSSDRAYSRLAGFRVDDERPGEPPLARLGAVPHYRDRRRVVAKSMRMRSIPSGGHSRRHWNLLAFPHRLKLSAHSVQRSLKLLRHVLGVQTRVHHASASSILAGVLKSTSMRITCDRLLSNSTG